MDKSSFNVLRENTPQHRKTEMGNYTAARLSFQMPMNIPMIHRREGRMQSNGLLEGDLVILTEFL